MSKNRRTWSRDSEGNRTLTRRRRAAEAICWRSLPICCKPTGDNTIWERQVIANLVTIFPCSWVQMPSLCCWYSSSCIFCWFSLILLQPKKPPLYTVAALSFSSETPQRAGNITVSCKFSVTALLRIFT